MNFKEAKTVLGSVFSVISFRLALWQEVDFMLKHQDYRWPPAVQHIGSAPFSFTNRALAKEKINVFLCYFGHNSSLRIFDGAQFLNFRGGVLLTDTFCDARLLADDITAAPANEQSSLSVLLRPSCISRGILLRPLSSPSFSSPSNF